MQEAWQEGCAFKLINFIFGLPTPPRAQLEPAETTPCTTHPHLLGIGIGIGIFNDNEENNQNKTTTKYEIKALF